MTKQKKTAGRIQTPLKTGDPQIQNLNKIPVNSTGIPILEWKQQQAAKRTQESTRSECLERRVASPAGVTELRPTF
jgi:hypothetical protein